MSEPDPELHLLATRQAVEKWLRGHVDAVDFPDEFEALNLRVWAEAFLSTTAEQADEIVQRLHRQGEVGFAQRVVQSTRDTMAMVPTADAYDVLGRTFALETMRLDEQIVEWHPGSDGPIT